MAELFFCFFFLFGWVVEEVERSGGVSFFSVSFSLIHSSIGHGPPNRKPRDKAIKTTYLPAEVAAVRVPVGVPAELVVHLHLGRRRID